MYLDMSLILQAMLSTGSLAAFTAAAPQAQQLNLPGGIRSASAQSSSTPSAGASSLKLQPQGGGSPPNRATPRGSLLDLSV
jgi:hypothetical protein